MGVLFVYLVSFFVFVISHVLFETFGYNAERLSWYMIVFWSIGYTGYCLKLRDHIAADERLSPLKRPIAHWVALGIIIIYLNVIETSEAQRLYPAINFSFIIFTLFLSDSYWDFKKSRLLTL